MIQSLKTSSYVATQSFHLKSHSHHISVCATMFFHLNGPINKGKEQNKNQAGLRRSIKAFRDEGKGTSATQKIAQISNFDNLHSERGRSVSSAPGDSVSSSAPGAREDRLLPTLVLVRAEREATLKEDLLWVRRRAEELRGRWG